MPTLIAWKEKSVRFPSFNQQQNIEAQKVPLHLTIIVRLNDKEPFAQNSSSLRKIFNSSNSTLKPTFSISFEFDDVSHLEGGRPILWGVSSDAAWLCWLHSAEIAAGSVTAAWSECPVGIPRAVKAATKKRLNGSGVGPLVQILKGVRAA